MSNTLQDLTVQNPVVQNTAASADNQLVRLAEARALVSSVFLGAWSGLITYVSGVLVTSGNAFYRSKQSGNLNHAPATSGTWWELVLSLDGSSGTVNSGLQFVAGTTPTLTATLGMDLTALTVNFTFGFIIPPVVTGGSSYDVDLVPDVATAAATIVDAATGKVSYQMTSDQTAPPGFYRAQFQVSDGSVYPATGWIEFEVVAAVASSAGNYLYIAYASDAGGTGFSLTPSDALGYTAFKFTTTPIASPSAADFAGRWHNTTGPAGDDGAAGATGADGDSAYLYLAFASDASGTGFSLTPGAGLYYLAAKATTTPIVSPAVGDFAGLWINTRGATGSTGAAGADGTDGAPVYGYVGYASDASGTGFSQTPGSGLNFFAFKLSTTVIASPSAGDFTGLWRRYAIPDSPAIPADTDDLPEGAANLYFSAPRVLATLLTGLDGVVSGDVVASDSLLTAAGKLQNRLKNVENALSSPAQALFAEGDIIIPSGTGNGTLSSLSLAFTPSRVLLTLSIPAGHAVLVAATVGDPATTGFSWILSSAVVVAGYKLHYRMT